MSSSIASAPRLTRVAFLLSGVAGLGYQIVWARQFSVGLGHEYPSVLAVVSAVFGGLALGAWLGDQFDARSPLRAARSRDRALGRGHDLPGPSGQRPRGGLDRL
ncbi:MAG: hypothetical protein ACYTFV_10865 [Planctomycetota bacterium]